jgi:hypothetical protein
MRAGYQLISPTLRVNNRLQQREAPAQVCAAFQD